jgi:hypothetical protein
MIAQADNVEMLAAFISSPFQSRLANVLYAVYLCLPLGLHCLPALDLMLHHLLPFAVIHFLHITQASFNNKFLECQILMNVWMACVAVHCQQHML